MRTPLALRFGPDTCTSIEAAAAREWLVADGLGGYAMGTIAGLRTRRYHGLLVVADGIPARRHMGLVSLDPVVSRPGSSGQRLGVHEWHDGTLAPQGHLRLEHFDLDGGLPRWRWRLGDVVIERELAMRHGMSSLAVVHRLVSGGPVRLELEALVTWRDVHGERGSWSPPPDVQEVADGVVVEGSFRLRGHGWRSAGAWWQGVRARAEADRGLNATEDLWHAGSFISELMRPGDCVEVSAWAGNLDVAPPPAADVVNAARARAVDVLVAGRPVDDVDSHLVLAADAFVTTAPDLVAGYPWFGCWSRDTMTSYEGLLLETGRATEGARLLEAYGATVSEGMLANTADTGQTEYNTVDGTLWFVHAVDRHVERTGDTDLGVRLLPALDDIVKSHVAGTRYGIRVDGDGLLTQGQPGFALTWMDARVDGVGITPRIGKPVEVNALWIHALAAVARFRSVVGADDSDVRRLENSARAAFAARFPAPGGGLYDVVDGPDGDDATVRPNQLLALSLPDPVLADPGVVRACADLLAPFGLRSLHPSDGRYRPVHRGGPADRDSAYHQGTVWPWLLGPYVDAALAVGVDVPDLAGAEGHILDWGLGSMSETADAAPPHASSGCPFQAWSVAEVLRARRRLLAARSGDGGRR